MTDKDTFLHKVADGKLLMRKSTMTGNVTCDCCRAEERGPRGGVDTLPHKDWCVIVAARSFFPGFTPLPYPATVEETRYYLDEHKPQFAWFEQGENQ